MPPARSQVITDILEEHFEELSFLWAQRMAALNSPVSTLRNLRDLEERIEAHVEGLLVGEEETIQLLEPRLKTPSSNDAFAAAYPLLRFGQSQATQTVGDAFRKAQGKTLTGLCQALCACCPPEVRPLLAEMATGASLPGAAAALEVLAFCSPADVKPERVLSLLNADLPRVRQSGWRVVALAGISVPREQYEKALSDKDAGVRQECLAAAAWTSQPWVLDYCRKAAAQDSPMDNRPIRMLAVLGQPEDLQQMLHLGRRTGLGSQRFAWLGEYGHPGTIDFILESIRSKNPGEAVAAGNAFTQITGFDAASQSRVTLLSEDGRIPDEFEQEFLDSAFWPDFGKAHAWWQDAKVQLSKGTRYCRGRDLDPSSLNSHADGIDMKIYLGAILRSKVSSASQVRLAEIERFPFPSRPCF